MDTPTDKSLIETKLCKLWARAEVTGEWWDMYTELSDISDVLGLAGQLYGAELFADAAAVALDRRMYQIRRMTA